MDFYGYGRLFDLVSSLNPNLKDFGEVIGVVCYLRHLDYCAVFVYRVLAFFVLDESVLRLITFSFQCEENK